MKVVLYSTNCPKCKVIEKKLQMKNIKYSVCTDINEMLMKGLRSAPWLEIDGKLYDFAQANQEINKM